MIHEENISKADFEKIIAANSGIINKLCYFYAVDAADFDDLRQEAMLNIWRGLERFRGEAQQSTWIYRVVLNSCVTYTRRTSRHRVNSVPVDRHPDVAIVDGSDSDKNFMLKEMYSLINCLDNVDKAIVLMWLDGNSYDKISEVIGIKVATVGTRLYRIKEKLVKLSNR